MRYFTAHNRNPDEMRDLSWLRPISALAVTLVSTTLATNSVRADEAYPVWFHPGLGIESVEEVEKKLEEGIPRYIEEYMRREDVVLVLRMPLQQGVENEDVLDRHFDDSYPPIRVKTCVELLKFANQGYVPVAKSGAEGTEYPRSHMDVQMLRNPLQHCRDFAALADAQPARESYLRDYFSEEQASDELFAHICHFGPTICGRFKRDPRELEIRYSGSPSEKGFGHTRGTIRLIALADFNGDGVEDALIAVWEEAIDVRNHLQPMVMRTLLATRPAPMAPIEATMMHHSHWYY